MGLRLDGQWPVDGRRTWLDTINEMQTASDKVLTGGNTNWSRPSLVGVQRRSDHYLSYTTRSEAIATTRV